MRENVNLYDRKFRYVEIQAGPKAISTRPSNQEPRSPADRRIIRATRITASDQLSAAILVVDQTRHDRGRSTTGACTGAGRARPPSLACCSHESAADWSASCWPTIVPL